MTVVKIDMSVVALTSEISILMQAARSSVNLPASLPTALTAASDTYNIMCPTAVLH